jgi:hypothetical protein
MVSFLPDLVGSTMGCGPPFGVAFTLAVDPVLALQRSLRSREPGWLRAFRDVHFTMADQNGTPADADLGDITTRKIRLD